MKKILIVDDEYIICEYLKKFLISWGYDSGYILNPEFLFQRLESDHIDLIILDIHMPNINGLTLLKKLRSNATYQDIPIIILTSDDSKETLKMAFESGATDFIAKPISQMNLKVRVQRALDASESLQNIQQKKKTLEKELNVLQKENQDLKTKAKTDKLLNIKSFEVNEVKNVRLTKRELEILQYIVNGVASKEIAYDLGLSVRTVEVHRYNLMKKMNVHDMGTLIRVSLQQKLVHLEDSMHNG